MTPRRLGRLGTPGRPRRGPRRVGGDDPEVVAGAGRESANAGGRCLKGETGPEVTGRARHGRRHAVAGGVEVRVVDVLELARRVVADGDHPGAQRGGCRSTRGGRFVGDQRFAMRALWRVDRDVVVCGVGHVHVVLTRFGRAASERGESEAVGVGGRGADQELIDLNAGGVVDANVTHRVEIVVDVEIAGAGINSEGGRRWPAEPLGPVGERSVDLPFGSAGQGSTAR